MTENSTEPSIAELARRCSQSYSEYVEAAVAHLDRTVSTALAAYAGECKMPEDSLVTRIGRWIVRDLGTHKVFGIPKKFTSPVHPVPTGELPFSSLLEEFEELVQDRCRVAALAYFRSTMAPELADAACERYLSLDREHSLVRVLRTNSATSPEEPCKMKNIEEQITVTLGQLRRALGGLNAKQAAAIIDALCCEHPKQWGMDPSQENVRQI